MFLAFQEAGARDWRSHLRIALDHRGTQHKLQFHHIFPKALLRKAGYSSREADDIANLSFISGKTNRQISDKAPAEYFPEYLDHAGRSAMEAQCIPVDGSLLDTVAYKEFLRARRAMIAERINVYVGAVPT